MPDTSIMRLRKKLELWELEHLRQHAADLADRLERALEDANREREMADYWHEQATTMILEAMEAGDEVCLSVAGEISVIKPPVAP